MVNDFLWIYKIDNWIDTQKKKKNKNTYKTHLWMQNSKLTELEKI